MRTSGVRTSSNALACVLVESEARTSSNALACVLVESEALASAESDALACVLVVQKKVQILVQKYKYWYKRTNTSAALLKSMNWSGSMLGEDKVLSDFFSCFVFSFFLLDNLSL